jgi:hypothetical protein
VYLAVGVTVKYASHGAYIVAVHTDEKIIFIVIIAAKLDGAFALAGESMSCKLCFGRRVYKLANAVLYFLGAGSAWTNDEFIGQTALGDHVLKNEFCHRTAADISVANEHYFCHIDTLRKFLIVLIIAH